MHYHHPVAVVYYLLKFGGYKEDSGTLIGQGPYEAMHLCLGAHVNPTGRFIKNKYPCPPEEPLGQDYLLLVTTTQIPYLLFKARGLHPQAFHHLTGGLSLPPAINKTKPGEPEKAGDRKSTRLNSSHS